MFRVSGLPPRSGWDCSRFGAIAKLVRRTGAAELPLLSVYLGRGVIPYGEGGKRVHAPSENLDAYQVVEPGNLVLNNQQAWRGSLGVSRHRGIISPAYLVFELSSQIDPRFGNYLFQSPAAVDNFVRSSKGVGDIQRDLYMPWVKGTQFAIPDLREQGLIVRYLAQANLRIDAAITAKRRMVALLGEADTAIANDVLGLAGHIGEKAVPWLGMVPRTWDVRPAKRIFREVDTRSLDGSEGLLSLRMREGLVDANAYAKVPTPPSSLVGYKVVEPGEMVMNRMRAAIGLFGVATVRGLVSPDYSILRPTDGVDPDFYLLLFKTQRATAEFRRRSTGLGTGSSGFLRLYYEQFGSMPMPVPPLAEQRRIVERVRSERAPLAQASARAQTEIELLEEFRRRLVSDVVTGRVDVRGIAASLPDAAPEAAWGRSDLAEPPDPAELDDVLVDSEA